MLTSDEKDAMSELVCLIEGMIDRIETVERDHHQLSLSVAALTGQVEAVIGALDMEYAEASDRH